MFDNSLKILLRTAYNKFLVFGLNVLGLSIGICSVMFITIYSIDELSFDKHFQNHDRIYRVVTEYQTNSSSDLSMAEAFLGVAPTLKREFAEVEDAVRISPYTGTIAVQYKSSDDKIFEAENTYQVDKEFFNIFNHSFIYGNETSLSKPNSIVITKSLAKKLFGENSPINKAVIIDNQTFGVTGVINDLPRNSDLYYEALLSHDFSPDDDDWGNPFGFTYVLLNSSVNANALEGKLNKIASDKAFSFFVKAYGMKSNIKISLQSLSTVHFSKQLSGDSPKGNLTYLKILITLGFIILAIVAFNHSNFSTSLYNGRIHELSVKKLMGVNKGQLIKQFVYESTIITSLAFLLAAVFFVSLLPAINLIVDKNLSVLSLLNSQALIVLISVFFLIFVAGNFYPVFYSLKNTTMQGLRGFSNLRNNGLRKVLVAGQLTFTTGLIFFTITVHDQINFLKKRNLGFNDNQVIMVSLPENINGGSGLSSFINELRQNHSIKNVSLINELSFPGSEQLGYQLGWIFNGNNRIEANYNLYEVDSVFTHLLHMKLLTGDNFSDLSNKSNQQAIVNQAFVKMAGYKNPESIVGETVHAFDDKMKIVGVVADFNYQDSRQEIRPLVMVQINQTTLDAKRILIQLNGLDGLKSVQDAYENLVPQKPFEYTFLDERVKKMFEQEETTGQVTEMFSLLAIVLAGIGLYSLSNLILVQRTKEIGVRKILGIAQGSLVALLSKEFLILFLIAFLISIPFAWTQSQSWLSDYAFKTDITIMTLALTGLIILTILIFGILANIWKSAKMNPVDLIKSE
jgi:putative ABC transport system permease protein